MNKEIDFLVTSFNNYWLKKDMVSLKELLHEDIAFVTPDLKSVFRGREICIGTIEAYNKQATTHAFKMYIDAVHVVERAGWLLVSYDIDYELSGQRYKEHGVEIWGVILKDSKWLMTWRCLARSGAQDE